MHIVLSVKVSHEKQNFSGFETIAQPDHSPVVPQPPCGPDLSPADFFLFSQLKAILKGC
jgi:hypothetical protein